MAYPVYDMTFPDLPWRRDKSHEVKIYVLVDPRDYTVRYVGITENVARRRDQHCGPESSNWEKAIWSLELHRLGMHPLMAVVDSAPRPLAHVAEIEWIRYYLARGELTNKSVKPKVARDVFARLSRIWRPRSRAWADAIQAAGPEAQRIKVSKAKKAWSEARAREIDAWLVSKGLSR